jgi:hypothetical protein
VILPERVAAELVRLHRPSFYYTGLNEVGRAKLAASRSAVVSVGTEGMHRYTCCTTCRQDGWGDRWPCETAALLVEAGLMPRVEPANPVADG